MSRQPCFRALSGLVFAGVLIAGCGKKEETVTTPAATAPQAAGQQILADGRLMEAEAAMQARNYDKAVDLMIVFQQQPGPKNAEQSGTAAKQMQKLQTDLARAVAVGDPAARAAGEKLRRSFR